MPKYIKRKYEDKIKFDKITSDTNIIEIAKKYGFNSIEFNDENVVCLVKRDIDGAIDLWEQINVGDYILRNDSALYITRHHPDIFKICSHKEDIVTAFKIVRGVNLVEVFKELNIDKAWIGAKNEIFVDLSCIENTNLMNWDYIGRLGNEIRVWKEDLFEQEYELLEE